jgi:hypothetical protein
MGQADDHIISKDCIYKNERYSVRENGEVLRYPPANQRQRPTDNKWTFGKLNINTGYLEIASVSIHRIVATAFHGDAPTKEHVVDHIDTNKQNNRPENLRWLTRLENIILNPITAKRIIINCGSIEAFLANPAAFRDKFQDSNNEWMCRVSKEEAANCKQRLLEWANSDKHPVGGKLGDWIYKRNSPKTQLEEAPKLIEAITPNSLQENWKIPSEFLCCPPEISNKPINDYVEKLKLKAVFSKNKYSSTTIESFIISSDKNKIWVFCSDNDEMAVKPYSIIEIRFQNNHFIHAVLGTYFESKSAENKLLELQGLKRSDEKTIDDML